MISLMIPVLIFVSGCATEHTAYTGPYHKVVVYKHRPVKIYHVKPHRHRVIYYYPEGVYYPAK